MHKSIETCMPLIKKICEKYHVSTLEIFGSAANTTEQSVINDIDFLIEFNEQGKMNYADNYFGLLNELESTLSKPIDLVVISTLKNPYFVQSIAKSRKVLYAA